MSKTIIMIHGMWGTDWYWQNYKTFLESKGYKCVSPVLRYHDMNPKESPDRRLGATSLMDYVDDLEKEIRKLDESPIIMGHSMGGLLAQMLGSRGLGKALVLLAPASPRWINATRITVLRTFWDIMTVFKIFPRWGFWKKTHRISFKKAAWAVLNLMPKEEQREIYEKFVWESGKASAQIGFWLLDFKKTTKIDSASVTCPVLVIAGTQDRITPVSVSLAVAKKYKDVSTYKELEGHAHWLVGEKGWENVVEYIVDWLENEQ